MFILATHEQEKKVDTTSKTLAVCVLVSLSLSCKTNPATLTTLPLFAPLVFLLSIELSLHRFAASWLGALQGIRQGTEMQYVVVYFSARADDGGLPRATWPGTSLAPHLVSLSALCIGAWPHNGLTNHVYTNQ